MAAEEGEISLKDLILKVRITRKYLAGKWLIILIAAIIFAGLGVLYARWKKPVYVSSLTFVMQDTKSMGGYAGLASQLGFDLGSFSGSSGGVFDGDNIMEFLKSRLLVYQTLLSDTVRNGRRTTLADLYMDAYGWKKGAKAGIPFFPLDRNAGDLTRGQDSVLDVLYSIIAKTNVDVVKPDKSLGFIQVTTRTRDETLSQLFTVRLVKSAADFYIKTKTASAQDNVKRLQHQADSLLAALNNKTVAAAQVADLNLNPARRMALVNTELVSRDKSILLAAYSEIERNLEMAKMTLSRETPIIQIVDVPFLPLRVEKPKMLYCLVGGAMVGVFLTLIWLVFARIYKNIMR